MKNERGLTLIELLAIIVILGIIMAVAIPAIGTIINHSKADTHLNNARQVLEAGKIAYVSGQLPTHEFHGANNYKVQELVDEGFLEGQIKNPSPISLWDNTKNVYDLEESIVVVVQTSGNIEFRVNLSIGGGNFLFDDPLPAQKIERDTLTVEFKKQFNIK